MDIPSKYKLMRLNRLKVQSARETVRQKIDRIEDEMRSEWGPQASEQIAAAAERVAAACELQLYRPSRSVLRRLWESTIGALAARRTVRNEHRRRHEYGRLETRQRQRAQV